MYLGTVPIWSNKSLFSILKHGDLIFQVEYHLTIFHQQDNYGVLQHFWSKHKKTNFDWWRKRFKRQFELVDLLRLDHFRALAGY